MNKFLSRVKSGSRKMAAPVKRSVREVNQEDLEALELPPEAAKLCGR